MAHDRQRPDDRRPHGRGDDGGGRSHRGKAHGRKPGAGKPYRGKPAGARPHGKPSGGKPHRGQPYRGQPGRGEPVGDKPFQGQPKGRPPAPGADDQPRGDGASARGRPPEDALRHERSMQYGQRDRRRGPPAPRGPWQQKPGSRRGGAGWDRRDRFAPPRPPRGPAPADLLAEGEEVVAGRRPVEEAFAARREARRLLVVPERRAALDQLVLHATTLRIPVVEVEGGTITAVSGFDGHQGVALVVAPRRWATLDDVLALAKSRREPPFVLALDHLEDPQNVGTLLRSAEACGVHGVVFPTKGAAPISPAAIKTSAGAVEHLLLVPIPDLAAGLVDLHARGLRVIGADGDARLTVREVDMRGPIVIVTGSEGRGLNARVRKRVDLMARIPMRGRVASLNASVAGSVFLFEAATQRDLPEAALPVEAPGDAPMADGSAGDAPAAAGSAGLAPEPSASSAASVDEPKASASSAASVDDPGAQPAREAAADPDPGPAIDGDALLPELPPAPDDSP